MQLPPQYDRSDPAALLALERQSTIMERQRAESAITAEILATVRETLTTARRIEQRQLEQAHRPKNGNGRINLGFVAFKDMQSLLLCLAIVLLITGHVTIAEIKSAILR